MLHTVVIETSPLAYWRQGLPESRPLMMLHGLGSDHTGLLDLAARLAGFQIIVPDLPGFGRSPAMPGKHTLDRYAAVIEGLRRHLGLGHVALLGHSLGADIALAYASTHPAAVTDLCLLNPVVGTAGGAVRLAGLYYQVCGAMPAPLARLLLSSRAAVYLQDWASLATPDPATRRRILQQDFVTARLADPRAIAESARSIRQARFDQYAQTLGARTLLLTGTHDRLASPASVARLPWPRPGLEMKLVRDAGHLVLAEQPHQVAELIQQFLDAPQREAEQP